MAKKTIWLWFGVALVILSASFYFVMQDKIRLDFQKTRTIYTLYNPETEKFDDVQAIEYTRIFDGTTKMNAIRGRNISFDIIGNTTKWYRIARFKQNITVEDFLEFDNLVTDIENVPVSHRACFTNAQGKIFEYLISNIEYDGETKSITSPFEFGKNMKVTFQDGSHLAKVVNNKVRPDKIQVRYKIEEDYQCFDVRLFDPITNVSVFGDVTDDVWDDPLAWNHNIPCGDDMVLIVGVATDGPDPGTFIDTITYDGVPLSKLAGIAAGTDVDAEMWNLTNPPCDGTGAISVTYSQDSVEEAVGISTVYYGVDRIDNDTLQTDFSLQGTLSVLTVPVTSSDQIVVDVIGVDVDPLSGISGGENQVERGIIDQGGVLMATSDASDSDSDNDATIGWGIVNGDEFAHIAVAMIPAPPRFLDASINDSDVFVGRNVNHSINITNNASHYIFSWNGSNCDTGIWTNSSNATTDPVSTRYLAHNVSTIGVGCGGKTIGWRFHANNSVGWSASGIETYFVKDYGYLQVNLSLPLNNTNVAQNDTFTINATVKCVGEGGQCGTVYASARYNGSDTTPDTDINLTKGGKPLYQVRRTSWSFVDDEGDGVTDASTIFIGDFNSDGYYNLSTWYFNPIETMTIDTMFLNIGATVGVDYISSMEVLICERTGGNCEQQNCMMFNDSFNPQWVVGVQNFSGNAINLVGGVDYLVWFKTPNSDGDGTQDTLSLARDSSPVVVKGNNRINGSVSCGTVSSYGDITLEGTGTGTVIPSPETLEDGEEWNISWVVNASGENNSYWIDVKFNSSFGNSFVPDNDTNDHRICIGKCPEEAPPGVNPDTNHSIWDGSAWIDFTLLTETIEFRCTVTQTECEPTNQDIGSSKSIYKICNNGTVSGSNVYFYMNSTCANIAMLCDDDYTYAGATTLSTTPQDIHGSLASSACTDVSCWADYSNPTSGCFFDVLANVTN